MTQSTVNLHWKGTLTSVFVAISLAIVLGLLPYLSCQKNTVWFISKRLFSKLGRKALKRLFL